MFLAQQCRQPHKGHIQQWDLVLSRCAGSGTLKALGSNNLVLIPNNGQRLRCKPKLVQIRWRNSSTVSLFSITPRNYSLVQIEEDSEMVEKGTLARDLRTEGRTQHPGILGCTLLTHWVLNLTNLWQWGKI